MLTESISLRQNDMGISLPRAASGSAMLLDEREGISRTTGAAVRNPASHLVFRETRTTAEPWRVPRTSFESTCTRRQGHDAAAIMPVPSGRSIGDSQLSSIEVCRRAEGRRVKRALINDAPADLEYAVIRRPDASLVTRLVFSTHAYSLGRLRTANWRRAAAHAGRPRWSWFRRLPTRTPHLARQPGQRYRPEPRHPARRSRTCRVWTRGAPVPIAFAPPRCAKAINPSAGLSAFTCTTVAPSVSASLMFCCSASASRGSCISTLTGRFDKHCVPT